jgi:hypothetical protein
MTRLARRNKSRWINRMKRNGYVWDSKRRRLWKWKQFQWSVQISSPFLTTEVPNV